MKITFDPRAADELAGQLDYLIERNALAAAVRLEARCTTFLENFLTSHPRAGKFIAAANIWETLIPGTRLIVWYRFTSDELQIIRIWHTAQKRQP